MEKPPRITVASFSPNRYRPTLSPQCFCRIIFPVNCNLVKQVYRRACVFVTQSEIKSQIVGNSPVVLHEIKLIPFFVTDPWFTSAKGHEVWKILNQTRGAVETKCTVDVGQKGYRIVEVAEINTEQSRVF